ncbi:MAG TPA: ATP-binding cassette domain-containing protein [Microlunatus sp.]|nr:ATP-binding cassette domain-containing protein [Microlunatus sp.]
MDAIEITGVTKSFGDHRVLDGLDLQVRRGDVFALLGPNGAGKTTMITILSTLARPDSGAVRVSGFDVVEQADQVRRVISLTGQHAAVDEVLSGAENLILIGRLNGLTTAAARTRATQLLSAFDLVDAARRPVRTYSGGMRRRLDLALGLVVEAEVIFLDEPTTGLDTRSRQALWAVVAQLARSGVTVLLTTQYLEEADRLADRVAVLHGGRIVAEGTPAELKARVGAEVVEIRADDGTVLAERPVDGSPSSVQRAITELELLIGGGGHVVLRRPTLDDVFLALTEEVAA